MKYIDMKKSLLALALSSLMVGCATVQQMSDNAAQKMGVSKAAGGATIGASAGCAGGAMLGYITGAGARNGCLAGAVVGGVIGYMDGKQRDLDDAKKLAEDIKKINSTTVSDSSGSIAMPDPVVQERNVKVARKDKPEEVVKGFKSIEIPLPPNSVETHSNGAEKTLGKIGDFAASRSTDTVIVVSAAVKDRKFVAESLKQGIENAKPSDDRAAKVSTNPKAYAPSIRYVPLQKDGIPRVTVAPAGVRI